MAKRRIYTLLRAKVFKIRQFTGVFKRGFLDYNPNKREKAADGGEFKADDTY